MTIAQERQYEVTPVTREDMENGVDAMLRRLHTPPEPAEQQDER